MRAHVLSKYGKSRGGLSFIEQVDPPLGDEDVRIDVEAVALNPVDLKTREGEPKMLLPFAPPFVLGSDFAGKVTEVGRAVSRLRVGDAVYAYAGMDRLGAFAESVVLPAPRVSLRPANVCAEEAACLPLPGLCALQAIESANVGAGARVLVHGGAGGVGSLAVQLAARRGAEVFATASKRDLEHIRTLGASRAIGYEDERFEDVAREVDLVIDTVGGDTLARSFASVKPGGVVASLHVPPAPQSLIAAGLRAPWLLRMLLPLVTRGPRGKAEQAAANLVPILTVPSARGLEHLAREAESPGLGVTIAKVFPFHALADALEHAASGKTKGRVVLAR